MNYLLDTHNFQLNLLHVGHVLRIEYLNIQDICYL